MKQQVVCSAVAGRKNRRTASMSTLNLLSLVLIAILAFYSFLPASAQAVFGSIVGTVTDTSGAVVPSATVTVTDIAKGTSQQVQTNASGNYTVNRLIPDAYKITVTAPGFAQAEADNVSVAADTSPQINLTLQAAGSSQTVTVTTEAPPLKTDRADVAQVLDSQQVQNLPNLNRNFSQFTLLTPGVQRASFSIAPTENPQGTVATESNGSNYGTVGWMLDGTDNREPVLGLIVINPTLDSISEMKVTSQNYPAEFGGAVGGVVTAQTRSGGNEFHGDVFEFRRSDAQEARDPFTQFQRDPVTGKFIPSSVYNQFGGSLGGPIIKDKAFFFLDYQGLRQKVGTSVQQSVPSQTVRNSCLSGTGTCDLSEYASQIYNPQTGQTYAANAVPASALSPQAIALLRQLPAPQSPGITNNYVASGNGSNNGDQADVRLDHQVTANLHAFGRYDYSNYRLFGAPVFGAAGGTGFGIGNTTGNDQVQNQSAAVGFDWAIHQNLLTDFRFGFLNYHVSENKYDAGTTPAANIGIANLNTSNPDTSGSPSYNFVNGTISNFGTQGCNCPLLESEQVFQLANNWTKIIGNHSIRFGGDIRYAFNLRNASDSNRSGLLTFSQQSTVVADPATGAVVPGTGSDLASLLLGDVGQFQRFDVYSNTAANRQKRGAFYAQDDWRITPTFTLNYGLRWDIVFPETVNSPGMGGFTDMSTGNIRVAGFGPYGTNANENLDLTNLGGRIGFAWQAKPGTVFRGAAAQIYDDVGFFGTIFGSVLSHNIPVVNSENNNQSQAVNGVAYTLTSLPAKPAPFVIPSNGLIPIPANVSPQVRPNTLILPKVDQWNLSLQQQITNNMSLTLAYVGNVAERIYPGETYGFNINVPVLPSTPSQLDDRDARRPYNNRFTNTYLGQTVTCCSQDITSVAPSARASYNALQTTLEKRFSNGLQFVANYTWSKAMNYGTTYFAQDPRVEYGPNDTNRNHVFVLSGLYQLPFGQGKKFFDTSNRWINYAIGGWQLAGTTTWESGLPFTPTYAECGQDQDIDTNSGSPGTSSDCRPDKIPGGSLGMSVGSLDPVTHSRGYFAPVAALTPGAVSGPFARPAFGTIGNVGRNSFRGPNDYFADASLFKDFGITERVKGQFQFQAFNVFNHVPLGLPSAANARCVDCSTGGVITSVDSAVSGSGQPYMRQLQFGARIQF